MSLNQHISLHQYIKNLGYKQIFVDLRILCMALPHAQTRINELSKGQIRKDSKQNWQKRWQRWPNPTQLVSTNSSKNPMGPGICRRLWTWPTPETQCFTMENFNRPENPWRSLTPWRPRTPRIFLVIPSHTPPKFNSEFTPKKWWEVGRRSFRFLLGFA